MSQHKHTAFNFITNNHQGWPRRHARRHTHTQTHIYTRPSTSYTLVHFTCLRSLAVSPYFIGSQFTSMPTTTHTFISFSKMSHQFDQLLSNISSPLLSQTLYMYGHHKYHMHIIPTKVIESS